jgi:hypothetical protein
MNYAAEIFSGLIKIASGVQTLIAGIHRHIDSNEDRISILKESRLVRNDCWLIRDLLT